MRTALAVALAACCHPAAAASQFPSAAPPLAFKRALGGQLRDPVVFGDYVYVPGGRVVSTWNYADPAAPEPLSTTGAQPAQGVLSGLTRWGDHLYASWYSGADNSGIAVYSLADPANPVLVSQFDDYPAFTLKNLWAVSAANGHLYAFDRENGMFYGDLVADPLHPTLRHQELPFSGATYYDGAVAQGSRVYATGWSGMLGALWHFCTTYDVSAPTSPAATSDCGSGERPGVSRTRVQPPYSLAFGWENLALFDVADPANTVALGRLDGVSAVDGFLSGDYVYALGYDGIDVVDYRDRAHPVLAAHSPIQLPGTPDIFAGSSVTAYEQGALVLDGTDRFVRLDVSTPTEPRIASEVWQPGGSFAANIALVGGKAVLLQMTYGLGIADADDLTPLARFDTAETLGDLNYIYDFAIAGERVYLPSPKTGLHVVDLSDPLQPRQLNSPSLFVGDGGPLWAAAQGDFLYVGRGAYSSNWLKVVDVSDPANPVLRGSVPVNKISRLQVHGGYAYGADDDGLSHGSGLHVFDVANPGRPVEVTVYQGCPSAAPGSHPVFDVALSADGARAYVACQDRLHILDVRDPTQPILLGEYFPPSPEFTWSARAVATHGDRVWFSDFNGVHELDVGDPAHPRLLQVSETGLMSATRLRALDDGRVFAFHELMGMHEFGPGIETIFRDGFDAGSRP
ncbi:hypothetical protein [Dokdonella sp.]|uniref:LVIVD repeat-containing protein n=1 Tax=Dokdonella sp. TaxID=2291710 RepID=UPI001B0D0F5A|nr:hypothetical protein [Dokdonella sp.]MBO9663950.1 hypothetical protein [Dokdonella sp.]